MQYLIKLNHCQQQNRDEEICMFTFSDDPAGCSTIRIGTEACLSCLVR